MPSKISCSEDHSTKTISIRDAALALSEGRAIGVCRKCGNELRYTIDHSYSSDPRAKEYSFTVTRAVRLDERLAGGERFDPFLLVLREIETGDELIVPTFWSGPGATQRVGQFPPLLTLDEWKSLFRQLEPELAVGGTDQRIRVRAYELYEKRGKVPGYALEDWLQAEAELTRPHVLRAAA